MFWIDTRPTSNETGNSQNTVNALRPRENSALKGLCEIIHHTPKFTTQSFTNWVVIVSNVKIEKNVGVPLHCKMIS